MKSFKTAALGAAMAMVAFAGTPAFAQAGTPAFAQTKIAIGCTATTDCASAAVALEDGIFKKNGLDAELVLIGLNSNIPAALLSDSIQIGGPTPSVFLQATDGGLDLVAVAGASSTAKSTVDSAAVVTPAGSTIKDAKDFEGKKVGAPGIGAFLHVLFQQWLIDKGVDPKKVNFVEVTFPTMNDVLKSGAVDAVVTAEPMLSRIVGTGTGTVAGYYLESIPDGRPQILYAFPSVPPAVVSTTRTEMVASAPSRSSDGSSQRGRWPSRCSQNANSSSTTSRHPMPIFSGLSVAPLLSS